MKISDNGIKLLKQMEGSVKIGNKHVIYDDKNGKPVNLNVPLPRGATIGYGHLIKNGEYFENGISEKQAAELLCADVIMAEQAVQNNIIVPLTQNQYDALVLFAYNIGAKNFANSTVVKYVNSSEFHSKQYPTLESAWKAWNQSHGDISKGLIHRRSVEWNLYANDSF
jgi:GH24 family phage-related lysozyme (muramidase)